VRLLRADCLHRSTRSGWDRLGSEDNLVVDASLHSPFVAALEGAGAAVLTSEQTDRVVAHAFDPADGHLRRSVLGQPASQIAAAAGVELNGPVPVLALPLGCGTFGGNSTTDKVTYTNLLNIKRLARSTRRLQTPPDEDDQRQYWGGCGVRHDWSRGPGRADAPGADRARPGHRLHRPVGRDRFQRLHQPAA
jgi:hypothetical protein